VQYTRVVVLIAIPEVPYAVRMTEAGSCKLQFTIDDGLERIHLGMAQRKNLYLIFKEAVNNTLKYAEASVLQVDLTRGGQLTVMRVSDNGKGFDPDRPAADTSGGNGLSNMRKRAKAMGGELRVETRSGVGTTIELRSRASEAQISLDPNDRRRTGGKLILAPEHPGRHIR